MNNAQLPAPKDMCDLFVGLLGRDVTSAAGNPVQVTLQEPAVVAVYVDDQLHTYGVVLFDLAFAAWSGAALALIPPHAAEIAVSSNALTDTLSENVAEIMNIMTSVLATETLPHLRLYRVYHADEPVPADIAALASAFGCRLDLKLSVAGYGAGSISIVLAA